MASVYLDNAATTPVDPEVFQAMRPYLETKFGNPSSPHHWGQIARKAIDQAREKLAGFLKVEPGEIIFTSCATESINLAHKGLVEACQRSNDSNHRTFLPHIITSSVEHKAVLETCRHLEKQGEAEVTYLPVDKNGLISLEGLEKAIRPNTVLVSVMYVNNEVGTIQPIQEIGELVKKTNRSRLKSQLSNLYFHTDATQAIQYLDCRADELGINLLSLTGHKFYAPKGIGALYVRKNTPLVRQQDGGGQEGDLRAGTENVALIVGLGKAIELAAKSSSSAARRISQQQDKLIKGVLTIPAVELTGHPKERAPHIASFIVKGVEGEAMLLLLSEEGIAVSSGSACTSGLLEPSHVLTAMGMAPEQTHGSLRLSLSKHTTEKEIDAVLEILPKVVLKLRKIAPRF